MVAIKFIMMNALFHEKQTIRMHRSDKILCIDRLFKPPGLKPEALNLQSTMRFSHRRY